MKILAFGIAKEVLGNVSIDVPIEKSVTVGMLKAMLEERYPDLCRLSSFMIAVNNEYAPAEATLKETDEVAIIPPVSGG